MKHEMAMTKNVRRALASVRELMDRPTGVEGMGLLWGMPGEGKTTCIGFAANALDGIYIRAMVSWSVTSMLGALMVELGLEPMRFKAPMIDAIVKRMSENPRPIFVDEADYCFRQVNMLDALRDIYDITGSPVVLIGMEEMARKIQVRGKFARRITQWIEFKGMDLSDTRTLADKVCEVKVADDLLERLHEAARANIGRMTTGLSRIEQFGRINGHGTVGLRQWADRPFFYDQPSFRRKR